MATEMCSSVSASSLFLSANHRFLFSRCNVSPPISSHSILTDHRSGNPRLSLSASVAERNIEVSWFSPDGNTSDSYGGWAVVEAPILKKEKKGLPSFPLVGVGTSFVAVLVAIAYFSLSGKGCKFRLGSSLHALWGMIMLSEPDESAEIKTMGSSASQESITGSDASVESASNVVVETVASETYHIKGQEGKLRRVVIPVAPDATQLEAISILKKLKIIEDEAKADELCTRRVYARWLVRAYSALERKPKRRLVPSIALSGSIIAAFDDVSVEDPDFCVIQSLAEAGIILSNLSGKNVNSDLDDAEGREGANFFPERFISRQDLIDWKAQLDYEAMPGTNEKISRINTGFMDVKEISSDASIALFVDMLTGDKSILKKVFGQGKRFQPNKPSTKAQAAVALTSGRIAEVIRSELLRLEAESSSKQNEMEEIRSELLERGDIPRYWDGKLQEERARGSEVNMVYLAAVYELEQEKIVQVNTLAERLKEKAAMDCQKHLLFSLKEEVNEMSNLLASEMAKRIDEQRSLRDMLSDSQVELERLHDAKSVLEAEIEAVRILRSWIEDEARKTQARAKVLEEVGRRWRWNDED